mgnify:CR=1 FL=1
MKVMAMDSEQAGVIAEQCQQQPFQLISYFLKYHLYHPNHRYHLYQQ